VRFHDGSTLDAEAVRFSLERIRTLNPYMQGSVDAVAAIEVLDPLTLQIRLKRATPVFLALLARPQAAIVSPAAVARLARNSPSVRKAAARSGFAATARNRRKGSTMMRCLRGRLLSLVPVLFLLLVLVFSLARFIAGDSAIALLGPGATDEQVAALRARLNLDRPAPEQFLIHVQGLAEGNLGTSLKTGRPVAAALGHNRLRDALLHLLLPAGVLATFLASIVARFVCNPLVDMLAGIERCLSRR
jgi:hypothetical protein